MQFGVTRHLIGNYVRHEEARPGSPDIAPPWYSIEHTFVMERGTARLPRPPITGKAQGESDRRYRTSNRRKVQEPNQGGTAMLRRTVLKGVAATAVGGIVARPAVAQATPLKMGISMPLTGAGFNAVGRQLQAAIKLYMQQHGDTVAGRKIELAVHDDGGVADTARRIVQDMIVNDKVDLVGIGITRQRPWRSRRS